MRSYLKRIKGILTYYDYEPLILFVALFDIIQLADSIFYVGEWNEWCNTFQVFDVYRFYDWMPILYFFGGFTIIATINNPKWLLRIIVFHTIQAVVYIIDSSYGMLQWFIEDGLLTVLTQDLWHVISWVHQIFWMFAWPWILFQMKKKELYQRLGL